MLPALLAVLAVALAAAADNKTAEQTATTDIPGATSSDAETAASEKKDVIVDSDSGDSDDEPEPAEYREFQQVRGDEEELGYVALFIGARGDYFPHDSVFPH